MPACQLCHNGDPGINKFFLELSLASIPESARRGCGVCHLIWSLVKVYWPEISASSRREHRLIWSTPFPRYQLNHEIRLERVKPLSRLIIGKPIEVFQPLNASCRLGYLSQSPDVPGGTDSESSYRQLVGWLEECHSHSSCPPQTDSCLPKRVLDLGECDQKGQVRLYESYGELGRYTCLSHCWGLSSLIKTTSLNIHRHKEGIAFNELPKTFQDAVTISRKLSIRHIWIDSLCIVQDDDEDWRIESSKMASIYQSSFLTIAASRASGDNDGCFSVGAEKYISRRIKFRGLNGSKYILHTRPVLPHDDNRSPLFHRAWFFQEWLLSPRVIQYADSELVWECTEMKRCECSPKVTKPSLSRSARVSLAQGLRLGSPPGSINTSDLSIQATWRSMVAMYSSSRLTYAKDIFPALSGAARVMQQQRKTRYVAGLWEDSLAEDLMWQPGGELIDKLGNWRAPSWSWASLGGPINYVLWNSSTEKDAQVIDISCVPVGSDPLGELVSGHIDISGRILSGALACDDGSNIEFKDGGKCQFRRDRSAAWSAQHGCSSLTPGTSVHLLLVSLISKDASPRRYFFLVLRCVDKEYHVYERIGIKTEFHPKGVQLFSKLLGGIKPRRIRIV